MSAEGVPVAREPFWPEGHPLYEDARRAWGAGGYSQQSILSKRFPSAFKCFAQGYVAGREDTHPAAASAEREALAARLARAEEERDEAVGRTSMDIYSHGRVGEARMESIVYELGVCSGWYFDDYDCSVEMLGVRNGWLPTKEERDLLSATGLCGAFLSYLDGTGVLVNLITGEHGPCSPRGATSNKSALVAKLERERDEVIRALSARATKEVDRA